jgi:hypothetical protein
MGTVVTSLDTTKIANELGIRGRGPKIGLAVLCQRLGFMFQDDRTAGKDTACTLICAVLVVLQRDLPRGIKTAQQTIGELEMGTQQ